MCCVQVYCLCRSVNIVRESCCLYAHIIITARPKPSGTEKLSAEEPLCRAGRAAVRYGVAKQGLPVISRLKRQEPKISSTTANKLSGHAGILLARSCAVRQVLRNHKTFAERLRPSIATFLLIGLHRQRTRRRISIPGQQTLHGQSHRGLQTTHRTAGSCCDKDLICTGFITESQTVRYLVLHCNFQSRFLQLQKC